MAASTPLGCLVLPRIARSDQQRNVLYRGFILFFTFLAYTSYHMHRKPISVVKAVLHKNCTGIPPENCTSWAPFDGDNYQELLGSLDYAFLFAYAVGMFISGHVAERVNLRYFLTCGMLLSGLTTALFGLGKYWKIHALGYYIAVQVAGGFVSSTGWPSVVTCVANWFGKGRRGFIMGVWNAHTSVGNILGSVIAGLFVDSDWALSFIVPGIIIAVMAVLVFFFLVPKPQDVGCSLPDHYGTIPEPVTKPTSPNTPLLNGSVDTDPLIRSEATSVQASSDEEAELPTPPSQSEEEAVSFLRALKIPGVIEFSLTLFFAKLVSYTFLFWLPNYIINTTPYNAEQSADLSTVFDVGGIIGGITAGLVSDITGTRATVCAVMLTLAAPMMFVYDSFGSHSLTLSIVLLLVVGGLVNGPYALITTAVSADLGTHPSLMGNAKALATVTAIIDGTGSMGAALGPLFTGLISPTGWNNVFYMLIAADIMALMLLTRLVLKEVGLWQRLQR